MKGILLGLGSLALGLLVLGACSAPGVEREIQWLNDALDPALVIRVMATRPAQLLIDSGSPVRRFGPLAGAALAALGLGLLAKARYRRPREEPAPPTEPLHPQPIEIAGLEGPAAATPTLPGDLPTPGPGWFQSSPSVAARDVHRPVRTHLSWPSGASHTPLAEGPVRLPARYRLVSRIGAGAMGTVYRAVDELLSRSVAIKVVSVELPDPTSRERFLKEARALAALSHPNIVVLHDVGIEAETPYMVMELLEGQHLRDVLGDLPFLPERDVLRYGAQVADALSCVHEHQLVHRDIKPENLMLLAGSGRVKLTDFGIAHVVQSQAGHQTQPSGTPYYMAPEQITGAPLGPWTDIYGLGATLFALMAGSLPFPEGEPLYHAVHTPAPDPRTINPALSGGTAALLLSCLAKDPAARPQRARDLAVGLRGLAGAEVLPGVVRG